LSFFIHYCLLKKCIRYYPAILVVTLHIIHCTSKDPCYKPKLSFILFWVLKIIRYKYNIELSSTSIVLFMIQIIPYLIKSLQSLMVQLQCI
jgi:hypothetical protein